MFNKGNKCIKVCKKSYDTAKKEDKEKLEFLKKGIAQNYQHHW